MAKSFDLLEIDWITAKMYGKNLKKRSNSLPLSKNGIEPPQNLDTEVEEILDLIDNDLFSPKKENFWEEDHFR